MSDTRPADHISKKPLVLTIPGMADVVVRRDIAYEEGSAGTHTFDLYHPPAAPAGSRMPAVVFVSGGTDAGTRRAFGCLFKEMASTTSWARLLAASGIVGVAYSNQDPSDVHAVLRHVRDRSEPLGIDPGRIGIWASSGNVPMALSVMMRDRAIACGALLYGYTLDWPGSTLVADTLRTWGFANPAAGRSVADMRADLPIFVARAGLDTFPNLNVALDRFVNDAVARNMPVTFTNQSRGGHAFDILEDTDASRRVIRYALAFLLAHLRG